MRRRIRMDGAQDSSARIARQHIHPHLLGAALDRELHSRN